MRRVVIGVIVLMLVISQGGKSQQSVEESGPLNGLNQINIFVWNLDADAKTLGLSKSQLESQVLVGLKRNIPRLIINKKATSTIHVRITAYRVRATSGEDMGFSLYINVYLSRPVAILSDDYQSRVGFTFASVWDKGSILGGPLT